jgi:hypothetical protein
LGWGSCHAVADELARTYRQLIEKYQRQLEELAVWCEERGLHQRAAETRAWFHPPVSDKIYFPIIPKERGAGTASGSLSEDENEWQSRFFRLRRAHAGSLFDLARRAVRTGRATWGFELLLAALRENPDDEGIRRILGFQFYQGGWRTPYEVRRLRAGEIWHEKYGWIPRQHLARYEAGLRPYEGRWLAATEVQQLRQNIQNGWVVETERYRIVTNHSLETGVRLAEELAKLYQVWAQLFVRFYITDAQVTAIFDAQSRYALPPLPRMLVVCFRDREDFRQSLRNAFPMIDRVNITGVYYGPKGAAYFFWSEPPDWTNIYHEATHQLFAETRRMAATAGKNQNFWVMEGAALYMETLREENGYFVLGGWESQRLCDARFNLTAKGIHIPLEQLVSFGMEQFQSFPNLGELYSQCAAVMHFLMHYEMGRYRDAVVRYLDHVYTGRDDLLTLSRLTGKTLSELDKEYQSYMRSGPELVPIEIPASF